MHPNDPSLHAVERPLLVINAQPDEDDLKSRADNLLPSVYGPAGDTGAPYRHVNIRPWQIALTRTMSLHQPDDPDYTYTNTVMGAGNQVHVFTSFNGMPHTEVQGLTRDEFKRKFTCVGITDDDYTIGEPMQLKKGTGLMLQGSCSILHTGLEPIAPFTKLMWDLPYEGDQMDPDNAKAYTDARIALNAESNRYHLSYHPPQVKAFDAHEEGRRAVSAAVAAVLAPLFLDGTYPEFMLLDSHNVRNNMKSKLYMTGLTQIKADLTTALTGVAGLLTIGGGAGSYMAGVQVSSINELLNALITGDADDSPAMLKAMCAQMYYEYLKGYKWFVESEYALSSGESKSDTAVLLKQREEVPLARHYSLFSAIEDSHRDVFGMSTDGANPGDILRMMN